MLWLLAGPARGRSMVPLLACQAALLAAASRPQGRAAAVHWRLEQRHLAVTWSGSGAGRALQSCPRMQQRPG